MVLEEVKGRKVPALELRDEIIQKAHAAGHLGVQGTIYKIYHEGIHILYSRALSDKKQCVYIIRWLL